MNRKEMVEEILQVTNVLTAKERFVPARRLFRASRPAHLLVIAALVGCNHARNADVMATVNGKAIMKAEMDKAYQAQLGESGQQQQPTLHGS